MLHTGRFNGDGVSVRPVHLWTRIALPLALALLFAGSVRALPRDVVNTLGNAPGFTLYMSTNEMLGQAFQTGTNGGRLTYVAVNGHVEVAPSCTVSVQVRADSNGIPGAVLESFPDAVVTSATDAVYGWRAAGTTTLQPATKYWVVLRHISGGLLNWAPTYDGTSTGTGTLVDDDSYSWDGGATWNGNVTNRHYRILVRGESVPPPNPFDRYVWITRAGLAGTNGYTNSIGTQARFNAPRGLAVNEQGRIFVADSDNQVLRSVAPDGSVGLLAGQAGVANAVDGLGAAAGFQRPQELALSGDGSLLVVELLNTGLRRVTTGGVVTTFVNLPDGGQGVVCDGDGNAYVSGSDHAIRKITPEGAVSLLAGGAGLTGSLNGTGSVARFNGPAGIAVDAVGTVYVADKLNHTIRKITPAGVVSTVAGAAGVSGSADGIGAAARFNQPSGVAVDGAGCLYVTDAGNHAIRRITSAGQVTTIGGRAGASGWTDGLGHEARFDTPASIEVDEAGNLFVADTGNHTIRIGYCDPEVCVVTIAGTPGQIGTADGTGSRARFSTGLQGSVADRAGNLYIADYNNHTIRMIDTNGTVSTFAGAAAVPGTNDGHLTAARFRNPLGLTIDSNGTFFVTDKGNFTVRRISTNGEVTTIAGLAGVSGTNDGFGTEARFGNLYDIAVDATGNLFVADGGNSVIRKIGTNGMVTTFAGSAGQPGTNDGAGAAARFSGNEGICIDGAGNLFAADFGTHAIRKITAAGLVSTRAGLKGTSGLTDGVGTNARFASPSGVKADLAGNLFVADFNNFRVRKVTPGGVVTTVAGATSGHVDGPPVVARFGKPAKVSVLRDGSLIVPDQSNRCVRKIYFRQGNRRASTDFDGDRRSDFGVYYPPSGDWYRMLSLAGFKTNAFGFTGTLPIVGDWDGDGITDFGCYHPDGGDWYRMMSTAGFSVTKFGFAGTLPIVGDWDGDGKDDYGCYYPTGGNWFRQLSKDGFKTNVFGFAGTLPIVGDWDGDGKDDFGCYHPSSGTWYRMLSRDGFKTDSFGFGGTLPIIGDWDGDGRDDFGCYYAASGDWFRMMSREGFKTTRFGFTGTLPIVGDWDGDGRDDFGCYYATGGRWFRMLSKDGFKTDTFGFTGTLPLP